MTADLIKTNTDASCNSNSALKPAYLIIYAPQDKTEEDFYFMQRLLKSAANKQGYEVKGTTFYPDFFDSLTLESLTADLRYQIDKAKINDPERKLTIITDNFEGVNLNIADNKKKLSTLIKNNLVDVYQGNLVISLTKI